MATLIHMATVNDRVRAYVERARKEQPNLSKTEMYHYALILAVTEMVICES